MKKALDQTVRELKRGVNKKVLKVPGIEQKILEATSNEPWGPHGQLLQDISHATRNYHEYQMIMTVIWKRVNDTGKNWRHVYKALIVLDYLVAHGAERVIDEIKEHSYQISTLSNFQYIDSRGRDQGNNVRKKCQSLVALVNDKERIQEVRQKALANKDKYQSSYSKSGTSRSSPYSGNGDYADRYDDERFEGRYGNRDDDRNGGYRNDDKYGRGVDSYNRDGDMYGRDSDERYGKESYRGDSYNGGRGNDDQNESSERNFDRDRGRSFDDDDHYSSRSGAGRADDASQSESKRPEQKVSSQNAGAPPSYEEAIKNAHNHVRAERDGGTLTTSTAKATASSASRSVSPSECTIQGPNVDVSASSSQSKEVEYFDEFDPRGSVTAAPSAASTSTNFFETDPVNSLALVPVSSGSYNSEVDITTDSGFGSNFVPLSSAPVTHSQPSENPFGEAPFKAIPQQDFPVQQQNFAAATTFQPPASNIGFEVIAPVGPKAETTPNFGFGDSLDGLTYTCGVPNGQHAYASPAFLSPGLQPVLPQAGAVAFFPSPGAQPAPQTILQPTSASFLSQSVPGAAMQSQLPAPTDLRAGQMNSVPQSGASQVSLATSTGQAARNQQPSKDKSEPKSAVWADTLSRGLVNLDISGAKINPLADIGIDFDSINRMDKRKEKRSSAPLAASTITMGRAMGAGSGVARAGSGGVVPPPNPMMGSSMVMGMNQPSMGIGMGMGIGMNQPSMGMGMGAQMQAQPMHPGMRGVGYNPAMGIGSYGPQQPYGGGYR